MDDEMPLVTAGERNDRGRLIDGLEIALIGEGILARFVSHDGPGRKRGASLIVTWETLDAARRMKQ